MNMDTDTDMNTVTGIVWTWTWTLDTVVGIKNFTKVSVISQNLG
jgi:hypothetical protein